MSYIIDNTNGFVSVKLTDLGRSKLAMGQLTFNSWAIGDSEVNYNREEVVEDNPSEPAYSEKSKILRPKDIQPNIRYYVSSNAGTFNDISGANISVVKALVNNKAVERGFFSGTTGTSFVTLTTSDYVKSYNTIPNTSVTGGTIIDLGVTGSTVGDWILFKFTNPTAGTLVANENDTPIPSIWYKIEATPTSTAVTLDRLLPDLSVGGPVDIQYYIYPGGEVKDAFGTGNTSSYWDTGTLNFVSGCDVTNEDVPVWNMNIPWSETLAGITGTTYEDHTRFGSYDYIGTKDPYLGFDLDSTSESTIAKVCEGFSSIDGAKKSVAILHYTNNTISNLYGEFFHIDTLNDKLLRVHIPTLMYHRGTSVTGSGTTMGMTFVSSGDTKHQEDTTISYYDLYEDSSLVSNPIVVGRVYPQLKIVVFTDEEIVAAMSYKSNRNWTLPALDATLVASTGGTSGGVLAKGETIYITYALENTLSGLTSPVYCQKYTKVQNTSNASKDIKFNIEDIDLLPFMRKIESGWDGLGFYADKFKLLYQIVSNPEDRPSAGAWKEIDYTTTAITGGAGETIDPQLLETQNPDTVGFIINPTNVSTAIDYDLINKLNLPLNSDPDLLQFGDERFFYGNIDTYIGANIYKTIFLINVNGGEFVNTTNPTINDTAPTNIRVSEIGIFDADQNLVLIGKLSRPVELLSNRTITFELSIDF